MLQITEEALEKAMAGLIDMDWGPPVEGITPPAEGVATAALHLLREKRLRQEAEALQRLEDQSSFCDADDDEVVTVKPGVPQDSAPTKLARPPAGAIPAPCPKKDQGVQTDGPAPPAPASVPTQPRASRDVGVQAAPAPLSADPSWGEVEAELTAARAADQAARQRRVTAFAALKRYCEGRAVPHPSAARWQQMVESKGEEEAHVATWKAERRARLRRQEEEERARARLEREFEEARDRRHEEEAMLQAARARVEEARRAEERAAAGLNSVEEHAPDPQPSAQGSGRIRYCCVCRWPGVRVPRRCPNAANHPPRPTAPPCG